MTEAGFWKRVHVGAPDECWHWRGSGSHGGYGTINGIGAHVYMYKLGRMLPVGWIVHHSCEAKRCVNPSHLVAMTLGTHSRLHMAERRLGWPGIPPKYVPLTLKAAGEELVRDLLTDKSADQGVFSKDEIGD